MTRFLLCIAALLCALAAPSAALAQGAGDEQYQDPFGDEQSEQSEQADPTPQPTATPAPAQSAPAPTATPSAAQAPTQAAPSPSNELPRTGVDAGWIALAGGVLLTAGIALRRRADLQR